jgi:hypothetical protein
LDYLQTRGYRKKPEPQNVHLARAALAPFEAAMWQELQQVERALRAELSDLNAGAADNIYPVAMEQAELRIVYGRYKGYHSFEHVRHLADWLESLAL